MIGMLLVLYWYFLFRLSKRWHKLLCTAPGSVYGGRLMLFSRRAGALGRNTYRSFLRLTALGRGAKYQ
jgi:hypothetical protein